MSSQAWINLAYLVASMLFIVAFKLMTGPRTAVKGNFIGAAGMAIALFAACCEAPVAERLSQVGPGGLAATAVAAVIGSVIGALMAVKYPMTGMPAFPIFRMMVFRPAICSALRGPSRRTSDQ